MQLYLCIYIYIIYTILFSSVFQYLAGKRKCIGVPRALGGLHWGQPLETLDLAVCCIQHSIAAIHSYTNCMLHLILKAGDFEGLGRISTNDSRLPPFIRGAHQKRGTRHVKRANDEYLRRSISELETVLSAKPPFANLNRFC